MREFGLSGPIAQWLERPAHNRLVPGSNPGGPTRIKWCGTRRGSSAVEQEIHKLLVVGSIPTPATRAGWIKPTSAAEVVELADTQRSGRCALMRVWVQIPPSAPPLPWEFVVVRSHL